MMQHLVDAHTCVVPAITRGAALHSVETLVSASVAQSMSYVQAPVAILHRKPMQDRVTRAAAMPADFTTLLLCGDHMMLSLFRNTASDYPKDNE